MLENNQTSQIDLSLIPDAESAVEEFEATGHFLVLEKTPFRETQF